MTTDQSQSHNTVNRPNFVITDTFWRGYQERLLATTLPTQLELLRSRGRLENFRRMAEGLGEASEGIYSFDDTDVYKWLEAACSCLLTLPTCEATVQLLASVEEIVEQVRAAQEPDGYLNTYYTGARQSQRWQNTESHELYAAGHLIQAALAHYKLTGKSSLLEVATRFADLLVAKGTVFVDSHPLIELALAQLARETGKTAYLKLAQAHLDARGHGRFGRPYRYFPPEYAQDHTPYRELDQVLGHAVRMIYLAAGATEICRATGEAALLEAACRQWDSLSQKRLYVTGGVGARREGEAFGRDYELPSLSAYAETCAAVGSVYWNEALLALTGDVRYAELLERTLYNAALVGISLEGDHYFYDNPLASDGTHRRQAWFDCACCPPNIARLLAQLPQFVAQLAGPETLRITLWVAGRGQAMLASGEHVSWTVATAMPWEGEIVLTLDQTPQSAFALELRLPSWTETPTLEVAGERVALPAPGNYIRIERLWQAGDQVRLSLPMPIRRLVAHPQVVDAAGRVALQRGPLLYCIEGADHPGTDLHALRLPDGAALTPMSRPELLGGVITLEGLAEREDQAAWEGALYSSQPPGSQMSSRTQTPFVAIPYFAWANREPSPMLVWIPTG